MGLRRTAAVAAALLAGSVATGCGGEVAPSASTAVPDEPTRAGPTATEPTVDPASVGANELGVVPVLMYHRLVEQPSSVYDRTPRDFREELRRLARENYVPVTTAELASGELDLPAGTHPVVLTFDDGDPSTVGVTPGGDLVEGTAVRILTEVAREFPGFRARASVYVNADPFGGGQAGRRALRWLRDNDFEIGNHTAAHTDLGAAGPEAVRRAVSDGDDHIRDAVPGYRPTTLALPFGARPEPAELALRGDGDEHRYDYDAVLLVGANPAPSPFAEEFDAAGVPRIRSQGHQGPGAEFGSAAWLDTLADDPGLRYTSDGDPSRISYPAGSGTPAGHLAEFAAPY